LNQIREQQDPISPTGRDLGLKQDDFLSPMEGFNDLNKEDFRMTFKGIYLVTLMLLTMILVGCQVGGSPSDVVEDYLQAVVDGDWTRAVNLSCPAWEDGARTEANSFESVEAWLEGVSCSASGEDADTQLVTCQGVIMATYGAEDQELPLKDRTYRVILEGGEWRMCGYQ
jgi:hypothetical protein